MCMTHDEHFHSLTSINRILKQWLLSVVRELVKYNTIYMNQKGEIRGVGECKNVTVFDTKYLMIFR